MREARAGEPTEPGVIQGVPDAIYHSWQHACSQSTLKKVWALTPADAYDDLLMPREQTPDQSFGEAVHIGWLQPDQFEARVVCGLGIDRRSKANKAEHEAFDLRHGGKIILKEPDFERAYQCVEALRSHELAMSILESDGAMVEAAMLWNDPVTGLFCKGKLDIYGFWQKKWNVVADLKKTRVELSDNELERELGKWGYDVQAAYYLDALDTLFPGQERRFFFIFINDKTFRIRVMEASAQAIDNGRIKYRAALNKWAKCCEAGEFPGWPQKVTQLRLKPWDEVKDWELNQILEEESRS